MKKRVVSIFALILCICVAFSGCSSVSTLLSGSDESIKFKIEDNEAIVTGVPNKSTVTKIVIPDEYEGIPVTKIADFAAQNLEYVTEFVIGKNVKEIGTWALENNQHIAAYTVDEANEYFCSVDGVIYTKDMKTIVFFPCAKEGEYIVADGVESIRTKAFYKCGKITKVTLPDSIKFINEKAFFRCGSLEDINFPNGLEQIGKDAFAYCTALTKVTLPESIQEIQEYAFYNCTNLLEVNIDANESNLLLREKWYPTNNGLDIKELKINWSK